MALMMTVGVSMVGSTSLVKMVAEGHSETREMERSKGEVCAGEKKQSRRQPPTGLDPSYSSAIVSRDRRQTVRDKLAAL